MFVVKKFDQENLENYKTTNQTIGNATFYREKFPRLPEYYYDLLESRSRREYTEEDQLQAIEYAKKQKLDYQNKLMAEYQDRENVVIDENSKIKCKPVLYGTKHSKLSDNLFTANILK